MGQSVLSGRKKRMYRLLLFALLVSATDGWPQRRRQRREAGDSYVMSAVNNFVKPVLGDDDNRKTLRKFVDHFFMNGVYGAIGKGISYMVGGSGTDDVLFSTKSNSAEQQMHQLTTELKDMRSLVSETFSMVRELKIGEASSVSKKSIGEGDTYERARNGI